MYVMATAPYSYTSEKIPLRQKAAELSRLFRMNLDSAFAGESFEGLFRDIDEYRELLDHYSGVSLERAKAFEVGFGQRPNRLLALASLGVDVHGIDIDAPLLRCTPSELLTILRANGVERTAKSIIRFCLFDLLHRSRLKRLLAQMGRSLVVSPDRFFIGDATTLELPDHSLDLIYSEDVFEHIPPTSLPLLLSRMFRWLKPSGLALIRPNIFTGIRGGHLTEWFSLDECEVRKSEPWEHLRKRRFVPNVYLNELRLVQYRTLFRVDFQILEERVKHPDLGKMFLTGEAADDLKEYTHEELFSNQLLFVLKPQARAGRA